MALTTNVFISGANRGLGKGFVERYLARTNHVVIGAVRNAQSPAADELRALPTAEGSKVILVEVEATSTTDPYRVAKELEAQGITKIDVIIANAGITGQQGPMDSIDPEGIAGVYLVNAVGPALLFLGLKPLIDRSETPKWMGISSAIASFQNVEKYPTFKGFPYNTSKAALNYFAKTLHFENPNLVAFVASPGFLDTDMGRNSASFYGLENPGFADIEVVNKRLVGLLDNATRDKYSGQFVDFTGEIIPW
ncbi:hypothetical protein FSARC_12146 [Fusarium sarcochroum]|uniref:Uncharacterized protein n=1 Tax=Fusarium sarcochroum TaxID=1208366 RepID=A0A8H4TAQ5_9HYPO|nr:hypothetical protein FSARC_12146 [Fusarium sarcochroum]